MKHSLMFSFVILVAAAGLLRAQDVKPVVSIHGLTAEGLGAEEGRIIETLIASYVSALDLVISEDAETDQNSDYTLSGRIALERDNRILTLEIRKKQTGETNSYTSVYKNTGEMVLALRSMIESAFTGRRETAPEEAAELLAEGKIAGTWRGDAGIEVIRLQQGGKGFAIFSSGARMELRYVIENNTLRVSQSSPNAEWFYHPVPYGVAKALVISAEPMRWELALYRKGTVLRGIKITTAVRYERDEVLELLPGSAREAEWIRSR